MVEYMLTTVDNPYNPFIQFDEWKAFDEAKGYFTCNYLARIAKTSHELSDEDNIVATNKAIDEILYHNVIGIYQKVTKENFDSMKRKPLSQEQREALELINEVLEKNES